MGLDMQLYSIKRKVFESVNRDDFWMVAFEGRIELFYWRKKYDIHEWFYSNSIINGEYSDEITKEKLQILVKWLIEKELKSDAEKIKTLVEEFDFINYVIYYGYSN